MLRLLEAKGYLTSFEVRSGTVSRALAPRGVARNMMRRAMPDCPFDHECAYSVL